MTTLLTMNGSLRSASVNGLLIDEAVRAFAPEKRLTADIRVPLYDGDVEESAGVPDAVKALAAQIAEADAVLIGCPEYNAGVPGTLKNVLDWLSRLPDMGNLTGKPMAIVSAAAGASGGQSAQYMLRHCLVPFAPKLVHTPFVFLGRSYGAFDDDGHLKDERAQGLVRDLMTALRAEL